MKIAIDGTSGSGKGTISMILGQRLGLPVMNTGKLYRYVAHIIIKDFDRDTSKAEDASKFVGENFNFFKNIEDNALQTDEISMLASHLASLEIVRKNLLDLQLRFSQHPGGAILEGRDIGTTIIPDANFKFFVTCDPEIRAKRRMLQLGLEDNSENYHSTLSNILQRDEKDFSRKASPLRVAEGAKIIHNNTDIDQSIKEMLEIINA